MARYYFQCFSAAVLLATTHVFAFFDLVVDRVARAFDVAFPAALAEQERRELPAGGEIALRQRLRSRTASYVSRRVARSSDKRRGAPMQSGLASAGLAYG